MERLFRLLVLLVGALIILAILALFRHWLPIW
jgi:hypothetical protein